MSSALTINSHAAVHGSKIITRHAAVLAIILLLQAEHQRPKRPLILPNLYVVYAVFVTVFQYLAVFDPVSC